MEITHKRTARLQAVAVQFLLGIAGLALTTFVCFQIGFGVGRTSSTFVVLIALVSLLGSFSVSVVLSIVAVACLNYFFVQPLFELHLDDPQDVARLAVFLTTSLIVTALTTKLRASEVRFRTFADYATDAFFVLDDHSTVVDVNRQACDSLGYSREELIGKHRSDFDAGLDDTSIQHLRRRIVAGQAITFESRHRRKDGTSFPVRFYLPLNVQLPNDFFGQAVVVTKGLEQRERVKARLEHALATGFPNVVGRVYPLELGPPVGWPLQYRVSGPEPDQVRAIAFKVAREIGSTPGAENINYNWMEPARTLRIQVDQDQARLLGLSSQQLATAINTVLSGITATQVRSEIDLVDVLVRASADQRMSLSTIRTMQVSLPNGKSVPLSQIASVDYAQEYPIVWRRDRLPTVTVQADTAPGTQAATVVQALAPTIAALNASLPSRYQIDVGGTVEESAKPQASVMAALPLMLILILTVLMIQLQSFSQLFLVLSVAPLGLIGVVAALLLADKPLGFVALLGVLALTGMIIRNSVVLIDQIETEKAHGRHPWDAVIEASAHRFRPILLTAAAAILGIIPIAPTVFWGPMAYAIMGGLAVATALTLIFLPALYVIWHRIKRPQPDSLQKVDLAQTAIAQPVS
jgi:PAS domain S-box-containing protein